MKWLLILVALVLLVIVLVPVVVTRVENYQAGKNREWLDAHGEKPTQQSRAAVVVFSRSGNTAVLAQHIANKYQAELFVLEAKDYKLGIAGLISALKDARTQIATITPASLDLSQFDTVYLGSPIWLYSPAPPIWQFAANNNFSGKRVVLFNTYNSHIEPSFISAYEQLVKANGAADFQHIAILRGRMGNQKSSQEVLDMFDKQDTSQVAFEKQ